LYPVAVLLLFYSVSRCHPVPTPFPYTTLFRSCRHPTTRRCARPAISASGSMLVVSTGRGRRPCAAAARRGPMRPGGSWSGSRARSEEHTSELQSRENLVCRLLLEKKKIKEYSI